MLLQANEASPARRALPAVHVHGRHLRRIRSPWLLARPAVAVSKHRRRTPRQSQSLIADRSSKKHASSLLKTATHTGLAPLFPFPAKLGSRSIGAFCTRLLRGGRNGNGRHRVVGQCTVAQAVARQRVARSHALARRADRLSAASSNPKRATRRARRCPRSRARSATPGLADRRPRGG